MSTALISARIPTHHKATMDELPGKLTEHINVAVTMYVESLRAPAKVERIPTAKKRKPEMRPLSEHSKARMAVLAVFSFSSVSPEFTSSDIAYHTGQSTNNAAKRIQELAAEGYLELTGCYGKSRDSNKQLAVWRRTSKELPCR